MDKTAWNFVAKKTMLNSRWIICRVVYNTSVSQRKGHVKPYKLKQNEHKYYGIVTKWKHFRICIKQTIQDNVSKADEKSLRKLCCTLEYSTTWNMRKSKVKPYRLKLSEYFVNCKITSLQLGSR